MTQESWLLIHDRSSSVEGSMGSVKDTVNWVDKIQERIIDIFIAGPRFVAPSREEHEADELVALIS